VEGAALIFCFDGGYLLLDFGGEVLRVGGDGECGEGECEEVWILHGISGVQPGEKVCLVKCETGKVEVLDVRVNVDDVFLAWRFCRGCLCVGGGC
jgi:hypothetical protein